MITGTAYAMDFGSSQCKQASVDTSGQPFIIPNLRGDNATPTALYFPQAGAPLIGTDAMEQGAIDPSALIRAIKMKLGGTDSLIKGDSITATDAAALIISAHKDWAEKHLGVEVTSAVVTAPANFRDDAKQALIEGYERNDIEVLLMLPEPTAAGYAYAEHKSIDSMNLLVFDFGGGTFDVSVIRKDGAEIRVLTTEGVPRLGGNDITQCIVACVLDEIQQKSGTRPTREADPLLWLQLWKDAERAKVSLGSQKEVPIVISHNGNQTVVKITQDGFQKAIRPLVQQSLEALDKAVAAANLSITKIDRLLMAGGTSRMPFIQEQVANHTGLVPRIDIDPEKAIVSGAALVSVSELARRGKKASIRGQVIPAPDVFLRDVTAHGLGCCVRQNSELMNAVLIPKNTPIPCSKTDRFFLESEVQTEATIEILQGEGDAGREDCLIIGELHLTNLPNEKKRTERIQVEYVIDRNGMATASATDLVSGVSETVSVDYKKGITPRQKPAFA